MRRCSSLSMRAGRGLGHSARVQDTTVPMILAGFSYWIVGMPASYLLGFVFDLEGVGSGSGWSLALGWRQSC